MEITPGRVVEIVGPINVGKIALKFDLLYKIKYLIVNVALKTRNLLDIGLPKTEGILYVYGLEILHGRVVRTLGPVSVGKIALKFELFYRI